MSEEISLTIREAQPNDASELLAMMQQVEEETDFLVMDEQGMELTPEALALSIEYLQDSNNNLVYTFALFISFRFYTDFS